MPDGSPLRDALDICSELDIEGVELVQITVMKAITIIFQYINFNI